VSDIPHIRIQLSSWDKVRDPLSRMLNQASNMNVVDIARNVR
jgi:hypothetical protein